MSIPMDIHIHICTYVHVTNIIIFPHKCVCIAYEKTFIPSREGKRYHLQEIKFIFSMAIILLTTDHRCILCVQVQLMLYRSSTWCHHASIHAMERHSNYFLLYWLMITMHENAFLHTDIAIINTIQYKSIRIKNGNPLFLLWRSANRVSS